MSANFLERVTGHPSPALREKWMRRWARILSAKNEVTQDVDVLSFACHELRVRVREEASASSVYVVFDPRGSTVLMPPGRTAVASRFAVAHELGHVFLQYMAWKHVRDPEERISLLAKGASREEERLCSVFAAELLLSRCDIPRELTSTGLPAYEELRRVASSSGVGLVMVMRRFVEESLNHALIWFHSAARPGSTTKLRVRWSVVSPGEHRPFIPRHLPAPPGGLIERAAATPGVTVGRELLRRFNLGSTPLPVLAYSTSQGVAVLVAMSNQLPEAAPPIERVRKPRASATSLPPSGSSATGA